ncbi:hypothetical protein GCM10007897_14980 [Sphingobium jiangsuense]|uniref:Uncharacterized protein n=1 Tax=Sphingobium jiangsuense TaxID=870476 RepID=A0A7W6BK53_9SPHN|nr:hypothetical protein [Sphingobium jiangsuense]MBB3925057.1 hypothetical protein [Sphingobium jiangsuense]GLT00114.1 hypothetical protein GCM10007897_14980 [Sphingobium jiangsuense]
MKVHVFQSGAGVYGFTQDREGANLPQQAKPWSHFKETVLRAGIIGVNPEEAIAQIQSKGYYITKAGVQFREVQA